MVVFGFEICGSTSRHGVQDEHRVQGVSGSLGPNPEGLKPGKFEVWERSSTLLTPGFRVWGFGFQISCLERYRKMLGKGVKWVKASGLVWKDSFLGVHPARLVFTLRHRT